MLLTLTGLLHCPDLSDMALLVSHIFMSNFVHSTDSFLVIITNFIGIAMNDIPANYDTIVAAKVFNYFVRLSHLDIYMSKPDQLTKAVGLLGPSLLQPNPCLRQK
jgi:hypothetical protein